MATAFSDERQGVPERPGIRIWLLQYGPCWHQSMPGETGSFDYVRMRKTSADLDVLAENLLIVSKRVIDGAGRHYRQVYQEVPDPKLVVAVAPCPLADRFWDELPNGWSPVDELLPVDIHVDECINGEPEALMAAVLKHVLTTEGTAPNERGGDKQRSQLMEKASSDA